MPEIDDEEWKRIVEEAKVDCETDNAKSTFWPSKHEVFGCLGLLLGAIGGPCVLFLVLVLAEWMNPTKEEYGLIGGMILLLVSIPVGAAVGFKIAEKIMQRLRR